jgi:hypothetical protein
LLPVSLVQPIAGGCQYLTLAEVLGEQLGAGLLHPEVEYHSYDFPFTHYF